MLVKYVDKWEFVGEAEYMLPNRWNRDEMFFRLGVEKTDALLEDLKKVENPNFQDVNGMSYLHRACQSHYYEAVKVLLEIGANPNINDNRGFSPIMDAVGRINNSNNSILELMLQHGLDLNKFEGDMTLEERIKSFNDKEMNAIVSKYYKEG